MVERIEYAPAPAPAIPDAQTAAAFVEIAHRIVWATVATVDRRDRPRSRILHPIWETGSDGGLTGWVVTRRTPLKVAHLERSPFASVSYWDIAHDVATAECEATWTADISVKSRIWDLYASAPEPLGFDFRGPFPDGPEADEPGLLRLDPWRLRVAGIATLSGQAEPHVWRSPLAA